MKTVTATELARNFRRYLDQVEFQGEELIVIRNHHPVAKVVPGPTKMTALQAMADLYRTLSEEAGRDWLQDSRQDRSIDELRDPWAT